MNNPYDIHSWSKQYREEALQEARKQHLAQRNGSRTTPVSLLLVMLAFAAILLGASGCTDAASSSVDTDTDDSSASASASSSASSTASATATPTPSSTASATASPSASASQSVSATASASPDASASASSSSSSDPDASSYAGMRSSTSWECYTFYSDGTVELRHGGTSAISDSGSYQGDENFGEIVWDSGRWTSTVVAEGDGLIIDDLKVSPVTSCF